MKKILFVHGFGVMKDSRGMFTELADSLSTRGYESVLFDCNELDEQGNIVVSDFSEQVQRLKEVWEREHTDSEVYIIAHSQGCLITALASLPDIEQTIFLAPPTDNKSEGILKYFKSKVGTEINLDGVSRLARSDGSFTVVPASYWVEKDKVNAGEVYREYVQDHPTVVVRATEDEVISNAGMEESFPGVEIYDIKTNHNFEKEGRPALIHVIQELLPATSTN